jgi:hypothetical protein
MNGGEVAVPIVFFALIASVILVAIFSRHRERLTMIEKGLSSEEIKAMYSRGTTRHDPLSSLKWGILFVLGGLAVLIGNFLHVQYDVEEDETTAIAND